MKPSIAAMILAGGKSSRMGQDKALIAIDGIALLRRTCLIAQSCTDAVYVVTPWMERYQSIVPVGCHFIQEIRRSAGGESEGPLVGFAQGLSEVQVEWMLLLACDLPYLNQAALVDAIAQRSTWDGNAIALLPHQEKGWEPLCGLYHRRCLSSLMAFIEGGGRSFQVWLAQQSVQVLTLTDAKILFNCNTPEDLAKVSGMVC